MNEMESPSINSDVDRALRVAVERVVRPIVATQTRKLKMRRELYAHALEAYEGEIASGRPAAQTAAAVVRRLGAPAELTAELQAGVHVSNRYEASVDCWLRRDPRCPAWRHAA
jgi:hypothetical protein